MPGQRGRRTGSSSHSIPTCRVTIKSLSWTPAVASHSCLRPGTDENASPSWSPDGKWIYFQSNRSGASQIWKIPPTGGTAVQVTTRGGLRPAVSSDGDFVYFARGDGIWRVPATGGEEISVLSGISDAASAHWVPANGGIYFLDHGQDPSVLKFLDFRNSRST